METYGDLKKVIKSVSLKQKGQKVGKIAIDTVLGAIPGIGAAKSSFDFFKAAFKKPDDKKTSSWLDKLDVDDEMSAIVDDTIENGFLKAISAAIENKPDDEKLDPNFDMNQKMTKYLGDKHKGRTITGLKENKHIMKKSVLKEIIKKEIFNILKEEEDATKITIPSTLIKLIKDLGNDDNLPVLQQALAKIKTGDENFTPIQNKELADTFIALLKNTDISKLNKFASLTKQIK